MKCVAGLVIMACLSTAAEIAPTQVPVSVAHEKGSFAGSLAVSLDGKMDSVHLKWTGTVKNTSDHKVFRVTFCVKAFDKSGQPITAGEEACVLRLYGNNWNPGVPLNFKGNQKARFGNLKTQVTGDKYAVEVAEIFDHSPNLRYLTTRCQLVWPSAIKVFADRKFRPTVMDKDSLTATFAYDGGRVDSGSKNFLRAYTTAYTGWATTWESFRVDAASFYLREEKPGTCTAELKMSFAGFGKGFMQKFGQWYAVESNFNFEKVVLDELEASSKKAAEADMDKAISQLPTSAPPAKPTEEGLTEKLQKLADMHSKGLLTDEEFKAAKAKLLQ